MSCPHARPDWRICPHCNGINAAARLDFTDEVTRLRAELAKAQERSEQLEAWKRGAEIGSDELRTERDVLRLAVDRLERENLGLQANRMDAPGGPRCACGLPSARESGSCQRCFDLDALRVALARVESERDYARTERDRHAQELVRVETAFAEASGPCGVNVPRHFGRVVTERNVALRRARLWKRAARRWRYRAHIAAAAHVQPMPPPVCPGSGQCAPFEAFSSSSNIGEAMCGICWQIVAVDGPMRLFRLHPYPVFSPEKGGAR
jgi:hypothetical protein